MKCLLGCHCHFLSISYMGTCTAVFTCCMWLSFVIFLFFFFYLSLSLNGSSLSSLLPLSLSPQVVGLNFSSATTPELLLKTFDHYCEYKRTPNGVVMAPAQLGKWLVLFCDEINLPDLDKYGEREGWEGEEREGGRGRGRKEGGESQKKIEERRKRTQLI